MSSLHRLERQIKELLKSTSNTYITILFLILLFLSQYSSGTWNDKYVHVLAKMGKIYTRFQTKTAQKPYPLGGGGAQTYMGNISAYAPPLDFVTVVKDRKSPFPPQTAACLFVT